MEEKEERGTAACSAPGVILRRISRVRNRIEDIQYILYIRVERITLARTVFGSAWCLDGFTYLSGA